jgi:hypothetical protein
LHRRRYGGSLTLRHLTSLTLTRVGGAPLALGFPVLLIQPNRFRSLHLFADLRRRGNRSLMFGRAGPPR